MYKSEVKQLIDEKIVSNESGAITAEVLAGVLKAIVDVEQDINVTITINPVVVGQSSTITFSEIKQYFYFKILFNGTTRFIKIDTTSSSLLFTHYFLNVTSGQVAGSLDLSNKLVKITNQSGYGIAPVAILGASTSATAYPSWDEIPDSAKVEFSV